VPRRRSHARAPLPPRPVPAVPGGPDDWPGAATQDWVQALIPRANAGDEAAAAALLAACEETPRIWHMLQAVAGLAERAWVALLADDGEPLRRGIVEQELTRKRAEVAGAHPSPLEALLAERVVLCWLAAAHADAQYARKLKTGMSFREGSYYAKRCEQTNRQLLKANESLARVRRLLTPMQINIGRNQVNVAR
jgi:hypothetical protein